MSRERAHVTLTLDPYPNQRQGKAQKEWSRRMLEKRFLWKELLMISPFGGGVEALRENIESYFLQ